MSAEVNYDAMFSGIIGQEYDALKLICPAAAKMSQHVGAAIGQITADEPLAVVELGTGTGITTLAILAANAQTQVFSIDNEPTMQDQAKINLDAFVKAGRLTFSGDDALAALTRLPEATIDVVASAYTVHNFIADYRREVYRQIFRVLKPGGRFINGDRYALDDVSLHTRLVQQEISGYFKALIGIDRLDLLEHWIVHLFNDESENHVMRESMAVKQLHECGFSDVKLTQRLDVNALLTAVKPK